MRPLLFWKTKVGTFYICQTQDGRFHPVFKDESLGSYSDVMGAVEDLAGDHTFSASHPRTGALLDTSILGIPDDPYEWERCTNIRH